MRKLRFVMPPDSAVRVTSRPAISGTTWSAAMRSSSRVMSASTWDGAAIARRAVRCCEGLRSADHRLARREVGFDLVHLATLTGHEVVDDPDDQDQQDGRLEERDVRQPADRVPTRLHDRQRRVREVAEVAPEVAEEPGVLPQGE